MGLYVKPMEGQELLSFLFGGGRKSCVLFYKCILHLIFSELKLVTDNLLSKCIFGHDFLSPRIVMVSGIENYPSACMSSCSDDLRGIVVTALRLLKSVVREYISPRINCRL